MFRKYIFGYYCFLPKFPKINPSENFPLYGTNLLCRLHYCVDQQAGSSEGHFDPNAVYAQVDKNKKRSTRRSTGKDDLPPAQHAPYPVDETTGGDSWV